ncbi:FAD-dependent oxidoreductase [Clostridium grantii]|uniref:L-2-hydroxyglutarate oxidase LhgO n=1 Tax=Clostridium grantii DSM 8605 TaxID=1121316 RepID=A0A1M5Y3L5_9CLOT|nr:FAD-dependent oxidoreductase [Clostridium grantii]SHI06651.1 L-2-hydroxyglutarate oxidase LhgO [Clostridium grantii DSM 8605]
MDYDILILGGGVIGCATAYELSKYNLNIALIEKEHDIANDIAFVDSALVYKDIFDKNDEMLDLQSMGNDLIKDIVDKFNIVYKENILDILNVDNSAIDSLNNKVLVLSPYDLALAYGEIAYDNRVSFRLEEEPINIDKINDGFRVTTNKGKFTCRKIINTTSAYYNYEKETMKQKVSKGFIKYLIMEKEYKAYLDKVVIRFLDEDILYLIPSTEGELIIGIKTNENISYDKLLDKLNSWGINFKKTDVKNMLEYNYYDEVMKIYNNIDENYIKIVGKNSTEATKAPAIAKKISSLIVEDLSCTKTAYFNDRRRENFIFRFLSNEKRNELIAMDKNFGKIICPCNLVTEAEIVDSIRRPLGARTVEAIMRRTGAGNGECKGSNCYTKIANILARETDKKMTTIVKNKKGSNIILNRIKEFDSI